MEAKSKNISISVVQSLKVPDVAIVLTIGYKTGEHGLKSLLNNTPTELFKGAESAALAFAIFEAVRDKLVGSPLAVAQSKVSSICCGGGFTICWNTKGTISSVRSTIVKVAGCLAPSKQYSRYADNIKFLGGSADRGIFNTEAAIFATCLKDIHFSVVGKLGKFDVSHLKLIVEKASERIPPYEAAKPQTAVPSHPEHELNFPSISGSGFSAILTSEYIRSNSGGMGVGTTHGKIYIYNKSWASKQKQLADKDRINTYVDQKYKKLKAEMSGVVAYVIATKCSGDKTSIALASKSTPADIAKRIYDTLK